MTIIVLEHPRIRSEKRFNDIANTPLWSCLMGGYSAASLKAAGFAVSYLDAAAKQWNFEQTAREILHRAPDMLCINAVYFWEHTPALFEFLDRLRSADYRGHINLFGFFPSLAYRRILEAVPAVDSIAVGECEDTLVTLAQQLCGGQRWRNTVGLAFRSAGGIDLAGRRRPGSNPDRFPFPERDLTAADTVSILASRGCYNHCSFCPVPVFYNAGPLWRGRSPANVLSEISGLMDQGVRDFYFVDPNFIGPGKRGRLRVQELVQSMRPLKITFGMETRPNDLDAEILEDLVQAGLNSLLLGIESGSPSVLNSLNKGASANTSERAISLCRSAGIEPEAGFLMFVPDSTLADLEHNLDFLLRNNLLDRLDRTANLLSHRQIVLMGTSGYESFNAQKRLTPTGPLGFEGKISYLDQRVEWIAELMVHACRCVLREMSRPESPVYWRSIGSNPAVQTVNDHLVKLFQQLLADARKTARLPAVSGLQAELEKTLRAEITRVETVSDHQAELWLGQSSTAKNP